MFYRRKILLSLLQLFDGRLDKIRLQKLLFLFTRRQEKHEYDFIPYKRGCYSYSAVADLSTMVTKGILSEGKTFYQTSEAVDYLHQLKPVDKELLSEITKLYGAMSGDALMKYTYVNYPYYATKSESAVTILSKGELEIVERSKPGSSQTILFTIGYEGISLEAYLNRLIKNDVKMLIDVRRNPFSMKYGFSKNQLKRYCENVGIEYLHFPELGIRSELRQVLNSQEDYDNLFSLYRKNNLPETETTQQTILELLKTHQRIALTCFEADICQCHRKHLAEAIQKLAMNFEYEIEHI